MPLTDLLAAVQTQLCTATDRDSVLQAAAGLLACRQANAEQIYLNLCQREALGSTAIGHGVAIPHGRSARLATATGVFMRLAEPVDFNAPDGMPVDLVFALVVPEHYAQQHLLLLANLAEMFGDAGFRDRLRAAGDSAALYALLAEWQSEHPAAA